MRKTGENYFNELNLADISIIGDYGIDEQNQKAINQVNGADKIAYGYLKDTVISGTKTSIRVFSETKGISDYEIVSGRMPENADEIAVASFLSDRYQIGDTISLSEKTDISGNTVLKNHEPTIVGFVNSSELLSIINMGQSTSGTGELEGYAVVLPDAFDSDVYMIARLSFSDTDGIDPYSEEYRTLIQTHKEELESLLADQPEERLCAIQTEYQQKIDDAEAEIADAKKELSDAYTELTDGESELSDAKQEYADGLSEYESEKADAEEQLQKAADTLADAQKQIANGEKELADKKQQVKTAEASLQSARDTLDAGWNEYNEKKEQLDSLPLAKQQLDASQEQLNAQVSQTGMTIEQIRSLLPTLEGKEGMKEKYQQLSALVSAQDELDQQYANYEAAVSQTENAQEELASAQAQLQQGEKDYSEKANALASAKSQITAAESKLNDAKKQYQSGLSEYNQKKAEADQKLSEAKEKLEDASVQISDNEQKLTDGWSEYNGKKTDADQEIADAEEKVTEAKDKLNSLKAPVYALDTRREIPGSEGYRIYGSVSDIVDSLAGIFPIFLYFVAALVTLTTMTRFVDEERINSGTLKALGYDNKDIIKKFTVYGLIASMSGAVIGIAAGLTLMPTIVYNAYGRSFTYPPIELHFYPLISITALLLAFLCAVVPAFIVAQRELSERPAALLMPKPPESGSKILLERIHPLWDHMSFTHKVTARNIFRYKKRMLMTIFGVCGSVTLIFTGFSVQHSISGIKDRQFNQIMKYDLIVAENDGLTQEEQDEINSLLSSDSVRQNIPIYYEAVTKVAGKNNDKQEIKLIVPQNADSLSDYITLTNRTSGQTLSLSDNGCIISEKLADLLHVSVGDNFTLSDSENKTHTVTVDGITEMYTGHFIFMNSTCYQSEMEADFSSNAYLVTLNDRSAENAKSIASQFMELDGVKGVVQNTTLTNQIDTIVQSLNKIMDILILVAILLAVVILYNLNNINVSERIRELSTIKVLGFYDKEVTMYIYRETILLTVLGILVGFGTGDILYRYIISVVPPDEVMFNPALGAKAFMIPVIVILLITLLLGIMINHKLKNLDMLEALKSVE